ncbi:DUF3100 domain-containing protein [Microbacterium indicum]|uniref:DUF3100 domain-containing protein n=1 Tax=Microbacterium indicum TaxID=358100 RepID=UPI00040F96F7|nr:DUF3100 domain-containing protein [Microbacterium indicum]
MSVNTAATRVADTVRYTLRTPQLWILAGLFVVIGAGAQLAGPLVIPLGIASITILPMVWAILAGGTVTSQPWLRVPVRMQQAASVIMGVAVMVLCARLSFTLGPNIQVLFQAGPALLLQELGHLFGTLILALPIAVLLKMGPATIGATFSIDREGSFAMVSERYGTTSPQYRGVLSMYVFGTLFGAVLVSIIASLATSTGLFDPLALAMGAGVGSGSMMAAAAAVVQQAHPELGDQVLAMATASNLITGILGVYAGIFIALPLADRMYRWLARGRFAVADVDPTPTQVTKMDAVAQPSGVSMSKWTALLILGVGGVIISAIAHGGFDWSIIAGWLVLAALSMAGFGLAKLTRGKVPAIVWVITIGALSTTPISPVADLVQASVASIDFLAACTVVLAIAGLTLGKDIPLLKSIGWKIIPVGIVAIAATYLVSVVIAEFALGLWS